MADRLESALVIALRDTIKWQSAEDAPESGTLTAVNPSLPFDARTYQERDRQLMYRDLIVGAAVVEVSIQVGDVWNYSTVKPTLQGPTLFALPFVGTEAGTYSSQIRHVTNVSIPYDAARYADADLYGRDSLAYEILARACQDTFVDPSIPRIDPAGTIIPSTPVWSLGEGTNAPVDINAALPLNRDLFKRPDQFLADRDNQIAAYVSRLSQVLRNPFNHALRLLVQVESYGTVQREADVYALISDDGTNRVFQAEPAVPDANQIIYNTAHSTLQWVRQGSDEVHVPQIYAMVIPGIEVGQLVETLAEVPNLKDPQYWSNKASQLQPFGARVVDSNIVLEYTNTDQVTGGVMQFGSASFTVPDQMILTLSGSIPAGNSRLSVLTKPNSQVEIAGAQNASNTSGTLGGATFDINVSSGSITGDKQYIVDGGDGIVYADGTFLSGDTFFGISGTTVYTQYGLIESTIRQYALNYNLALPAGAWEAVLEYTNLTGSTDGFLIKGQYVAAGANPVDVIQDIAPVPFTTDNGNVVLTRTAGMDVASSAPFTFAIYWTGGEGQLHIRKLIFTKLDTPTGYFAIDGTIATGTASVANHGIDGICDVLRWEFNTGSISGSIPVTLNYIADSTLPLQIQQVQIQVLTDYQSTVLSQGFQGWRQECLNRAERVIQQGYELMVAGYGTDLPSVIVNGSYWNQDSTESWMGLIEVYNPRVREIPAVPQDSIVVGRQYQVDTTFAVYNGTTYTQGQKFYGVADVTTYSSGSVHQVGAFLKSRAGHIGRPALVPRGTYLDDDAKVIRAFYDTGSATPIVMACQPWMIEQGFYVANENFWMPETL